MLSIKIIWQFAPEINRIIVEFQTASEYLRKLNQVYHWVLAAPLLFFAFIFLERENDSWTSLIHDPDFLSLTLYILAPVSTGLIIVGLNSYRKIDINTSDLKEKLEIFSQQFIKFHVYVTSAGFISLVGLYISANQLFLGLFILALFISSIQRPSARSVGSKLKLKKEEFNVLYKDLPFQNGNDSQNGNSDSV